MLTEEFLAEFKKLTEERWSRQSIDPNLYGFQFQRGTRWNPGLSDHEITQFDNTLGLRFPHDFRAFLSTMNGTDVPTLNVYASLGEPQRLSSGVYSYPRDMEIIRLRIEDIRARKEEIVADLRDQSFEFPAGAGLVPVYSHRYLMCTADLNQSVVLSIYVPSTDAIVHSNSLEEYLRREFLGEFQD
jgi:hypothetical protein